MRMQIYIYGFEFPPNQTPVRNFFLLFEMETGIINSFCDIRSN